MKDEDTKVSVDEFGFKTTEEGDEYIMYHFLNPSAHNIKDTLDYLKNCDDDICVSASYKNKDGEYEASPFNDSSIGFIIDGNYEIKHMFKQNINSKKNWNKTEFDENNRITKGRNEGIKDYFIKDKSNNDNEKNFINHLRHSDERWKAIIYELVKHNANKIANVDNNDNDIHINDDLAEEIVREQYTKYNNSRMKTSTFSLFKYEGSKEASINIGGNNNRVEMDLDNYDVKDDDDFEKIIENLRRSINHKSYAFQFKIKNNEIHLNRKTDKHLGIKSLFINLSKRKNSIESKLNGQNLENSRRERLEEIAENMNDIIDMQLNTFNHINIPFRDEKDKKISFPTLYEFVAKIKEICEETNVAIPDNYPSTEKVVELCEKKMEEKFQNKINKIFGKKKRCFFKDNSHKLLNERNSYWKHSLFIKRANEIYDEMLTLRDNIKDIKDVAGTIDCVESNDINAYKSIVYVNNMLIFYNAISEYEKLMKTTDEEKTLVTNSLSEKSLNSLDEKAMRV